MNKFLETTLVFLRFGNILNFDIDLDLFLNYHCFSNQIALYCAKMYESIYEYIAAIVFKLIRFFPKLPNWLLRVFTL